jgi:hypothetical protein
VYLVYLAVFLELASRMLLAVGPVYRLIRGRNDDSSRRLEWIRWHRQQTGLGGQYTFDVYDPMRGWAVKPNLRNLPVFEGKTLSSNSRGIRGTVEFSYEPQARRPRLITLGDSYTFGDEVSDNETYSWYVGQMLPGTDVLNLGVHGYGHDQMLMYLEQEGLKYHPNVLLIGYVWFDIYRNLFDFSNYAKPTFTGQPAPHWSNIPVPAPETVLEQEIYRSKAHDLGIMLFGSLAWNLGWYQSRAERLAYAIFDEIVTTGRRNQAIPLFVYLPVLQELLNRDESFTPNERFLLEYCRTRKVACFFLRNRFLEEEEKGVQFNTRSHWFANGHRTAAERIVQYLQENRLLQSAPPLNAPPIAVR